MSGSVPIYMGVGALGPWFSKAGAAQGTLDVSPSTSGRHSKACSAGICWGRPGLMLHVLQCT